MKSLGLSSNFNKVINYWDKFWFAPKDLIGLACMRILLYGTLLCMYAFRQLNMDFFDGTGLIPRDRAMEIMPDFYRGYFPWFFWWPDSLAWLVHAVYVVLLAMLLLGVLNRYFAIFAWIIHVGFIHRNYSAIFGADYIGGIFILYLAFTNSDQYLSLSSWYRKRFKSNAIDSKQSDLLSSVFYRLIQIHISVIYAYTGFEKLKGATWWDGTALWTVLANPQMAIADFGFVRQFPLLIGFLTLMTLVFEIYFPAAMLSSKARYPWLLLGVLFHCGIGLTLGLFPFSLVMISTYFLFLNPSLIRSALAKAGLQNWI